MAPTHLPSRDGGSSGPFGSPQEGHGAGGGGTEGAVPGGDGAELSLEVQTGGAGLGHRGGGKGSAGRRKCTCRGEKGLSCSGKHVECVWGGHREQEKEGAGEGGP